MSMMGKQSVRSSLLPSLVTDQYKTMQTTIPTTPAESLVSLRLRQRFIKSNTRTISPEGLPIKAQLQIFKENAITGPKTSQVRK